jgi:hypothetical protein
MRRLALTLVLGSALLAARPAHAVSLGVDFGGGYWFLDTAQFDLHFKVQFPLGKYVSVGARPGVMINVRPAVEIGIPVDAYFRFHVSRVYFDVLGGLAVLLGNSLPLRAHAAAGMGVHFGKVFSLGFEAVWLMDGAQLLVRFSFAF